MKKILVAPVRERGLKSELLYMCGRCRWVAPVRERGLKYFAVRVNPAVQRSLP